MGSIPTVGILFPVSNRAASVACVSCSMRREHTLRLENFCLPGGNLEHLCGGVSVIVQT